MATQEQIDALVVEIKLGMEAKGFEFGSFSPDYQTLFTEVYAEKILTYGGGSGGGPVDGSDIDWETVSVEDLMGVISTHIKQLDLYHELSDKIDTIPDLRDAVENILSNISDDWSSLNLYSPGQVVVYNNKLYECTQTVSILNPVPDSPDIDTVHWKLIGDQVLYYDSVDNLITQVYTAQSVADGAASDTSFLSSQLLGEDGTTNVSGIIWSEREAITGENGALVQATDAMQASFLGPDYDPEVPILGDITSGYLWDIILDANVTGSLADQTETLQTQADGFSAAITTEQSVRAIVTGSDYDPGSFYQNNAVVVHGDALWANKTGSINTGAWNVNDWTRIDANVYGTYKVKIDVNGYVSGFGMSNDGSTSAFIIRADVFAIAPPDGLGDAVIPFIVDAQDNKVYIDNAYIRNITADNISLGTEITDSEDYDFLGDIANFNKAIEEDYLLLATTTGEIVNQLPNITDGIDNFNFNNDRLSASVDAPGILGTGDAIDFSFNSDGTANIDFEWTYGSGTDETNIDGFIIYIKSADVATVYDLNNPPDFTGITFTQATAEIDHIRFMSLSPDKYYTIGIEAFRVVDSDINATGIIRSVITQPSLSEEKTIFLSLLVPPPTGVAVSEVA
jgi:hypothetical protein